MGRLVLPINAVPQFAPLPYSRAAGVFKTLQEFPMIEIKTPKGTAGNLYLVRPDTKFDSKGTYKVDITLNAAEAGQIVGACKEEAIKVFGPKKAAKTEIPGNENGDGTITFRFRSRSRPNVYDSKSNLIAPEAIEASRIGVGSTIRINGKAETYEGFGGGVTLYLLEVQVIHLVTRKISGFESDVEGSFVSQDKGVLNR